MKGRKGSGDRSPDSAAPGITEDEQLADYIYEHLDEVHYVQVPPLIIFVVVALYCAFGALLLSQWEGWTLFEAFYFSFVSVFKIGFGDFVPKNSKFVLLSLLYVFVGLILTTACIDAVGVNYLNKLHNLGRRLENIDPLAELQRSRYRQQRKENMQNLFSLATLLKNFKTASTDEDRSPITPIDPTPPSQPRDFRVLTVSPYSVALKWDPPEMGCDSTLTYTIRCKPKRSSWPHRLSRPRHRFRKPSTIPQQIKGLTETEVVITGLVSFSIYEFKLWAVNQFGKSSSIRLCQITEPETAPQNIKAEILSSSKIRLKWDSPYKKQKDIESYNVYYTQNPVEPYEQWKKRITASVSRSLTLESLEGETTYAFSVAAQYPTGHSPISRSLVATTVASTADNNGNNLLIVETTLSNFDVNYNVEESTTEEEEEEEE